MIQLIPPGFEEKHQTGWKEKMDSMLDKMFDVEGMFRDQTIKLFAATVAISVAVMRAGVL